MPELGKYAVEVFSAYVVVILALLALVGMTWRRSRRVKRALDVAEERAGNG